MKYKVKFRVTREDGKKQKYAINMEDGAHFAVGTETLGIELARSSDPKIFCTLSLREPSLFVTDAGNPGALKLNNKTGPEFEIKPGDCVQVNDYTIEFLEVPYVAKTAAATQFLDISEMFPDKAKAQAANPAARKAATAATRTQLTENIPTERVEGKMAQEHHQTESHQAEPKQSEHHEHQRDHHNEKTRSKVVEKPVEKVVAPADGMSFSDKHPIEQSAQDPFEALKNVGAAREGLPDADQAAAAMRAEPVERTLMSISRVQQQHAHAHAQRLQQEAEEQEQAEEQESEQESEESEQETEEQPARQQARAARGSGTGNGKHIAASVAILAVGSAVTVQMIMRNQPENPIAHFGALYGAGAGVGIGMVLALVFQTTTEFFDMKSQFHDYLRFFAYYSFMAILWGVSFAFAPAVVVFFSAMALIVFVGAFAVKFAPNMQRFFAAMGMAAACAGAGFWSMFHAAVPSNAPAEVAAVKVETREPASVGGGQDVTPTGVQAAQPQAAAPAAPVAVQPQAPVATAPVAVAPPSLAPAAEAPAEEPGVKHKTSTPDQFAIEEFFNAVKSNNLAVVRTMVEKGTVDPDFTLDHGTTALMHASAQGYINMVRYLIGKRVAINAQDPNGTTALMWAAYRGHKDVVSYLVSKGADMSIKREDGDRAVDIARRWKQGDVVKLLTVLQQRAIASQPSKYAK